MASAEGRKHARSFSALADPSAVVKMQPSNVAPIKTLDKNGEEITTVGFNRFGFDCEVPLDVVRALYLRPHYIVTQTSDETDIDSK